jgi:hypothetical protein
MTAVSRTATTRHARLVIGFPAGHYPEKSMMLDCSLRGWRSATHQPDRFSAAAQSVVRKQPATASTE